MGTENAENYAQHLAKSEIKEFVVDILMSKVSTRVLSESQALKLVSGHVLLRDSIFKFDLSLFYTVSKVSLLSFNFMAKNADILTQTPIIKDSLVAYLLEVSN